MLNILLPLLFVLQSFAGNPDSQTETKTLQTPEIEMLTQKEGISIRGLSVVDNQTAWVSASYGWTAVSSNGGTDWHWRQVPGQENTDFRSIYAFSKDKAIVMSAGSPLVILMTEDGGRTWQEKHKNTHTDIFFDGMDFWDEKHGMAYGDPINGFVQILITNDGGHNWQDLSENTKGLLQEGEAGFAASGTGIRTLGNGVAFIGTGGSRAQLLMTKDFGKNWKAYPCPIIQGTSSTGIFSLAFRNDNQGVAVGGDYLKDKQAEKAILITNDGGQSWQKPESGTLGYRSSVEYLNSQTLVATGTSGVDWSGDGGLNWKSVSDKSFHVARKARQGTWTLLAGADGRIAKLTY